VFGATKEDNTNPKPSECLVLKSAWRASGRPPESTLYAIINKPQGGDNMPTLCCIAELVDAGDVMTGEEALQDDPPTSSEINGRIVKQRVAMRVSSHRRFVEDAESNAHNPTRHRVVLETRDRSMVSYTSFVEATSRQDVVVISRCATSATSVILHPSPSTSRVNGIPRIGARSDSTRRSSRISSGQRGGSGSF
jgi:hypothetical protein